MRRFYKTLPIILLAFTSQFAWSQSGEGAIDITCTAPNFSRYFKLTLSEIIKVHWETIDADEPWRKGNDVATEKSIDSCIKKSGGKVECLYMNRITGEFIYNYGYPEESHANWPIRSSWYPNTETHRGRCVAGKVKAF